MVLIHLLALAQLTQALNIQLLTTSSTDQRIFGSILQYLQASKHEITVTPIISIQTLSSLPGSQIDFALDLRGSILYEKELRDYSEANHIVIFDLDASNFIKSPWRFCLHSHSSYHASSILLLSQELQWMNLALISQTDSFSIQISGAMQGSSTFLYSSFVSIDSASNTFNNIVTRGLKKGGFKQIIVIGQGGFVDKLVSAMQVSMMYYYSGVISGSYGIWSYYNEKSVVVVEEGLESALAEEHYEILAVEYFIKLIAQEIGSGPVDGILLQSYLESITVDHMKYPRFTIVNKVNLAYMEIGKIDNGVLNLTTTPTFILGNPDNYPVIIRNSISMYNPPGFPNATAAPYFQSGAVVALQLTMQTQDKLKNHLVQPFLAACGAEFFFEPLSMACWSQAYMGLGTFYLTSPIFEVTEGENSVFQQLQLKVPMIGGFDTTAALSNRTEYPYFTRVVGSLNTASFLINLFNPLGWDQFAVIYTNSTINQASYLGIIDTGIKIVNNEELRVLPVGYNSSMFSEYKKVFEEVDRVKIRTIFILADTTEMFYIAEGFYDIGLKKGDLIGFFVRPISSILNSMPDKILKEKFIEIFDYSVMALGQEWIGAYGQTIKGLIQSAIGNMVDYTCYSFDAMMLGINALDYLLNSGQQYEDPDTLLKSIRMQRFIGCSGIITIQDDTNDRRNYNYGVYQILYDNSTDSYSDVHIVSFDKEAVTIFTTIQNFTWPSRFTSTPPSSRLSGLSCPFEDREVEVNQKSQGLFYLFLLFFLAYTTILGFIIWKKWWNKPVKMIEAQIPEKFGDFIVMILILVDLLQMISMGPDLSPLIFKLLRFPDAVALNLSNIIDFNRELYWAVLYVALLFILFFSVLSVIIICRYGERYDWQILKLASKLGIVLIPATTEALFIPVLSITFFMFDCQDGTGDSLTESFMSKDCYTNCWKSSHLSFVILTFLGLLAYLPFSLFLRPLWQELESDVNIHSNSAILSIKGIVQVLVVVLNRTVKEYSEALHGISFIIIFILFSLVMMKVKPYNYSRTVMWKQLSHAALVWSCLNASIYWYTKAEPYIWTSLIVVGWVAIAGIGLLYQKYKYPSLLMSEKPLDISALVKFTFSKSVKIESLPIKRMSSVNFVKSMNYEVRDDEEEAKEEPKRSSATLYQTGGFPPVGNK